MHAILAAAALAAAFLSAGCVTTGRNGADSNEPSRVQRVPVGKPASLKPGATFRVYAKTEASIGEQSMEDHLFDAVKTKNAEAREAARQLAERIGEKSGEQSADELAWNLAANLEGTVSLFIHAAFVQAFDKLYPSEAPDHDNLSLSYRVSTRETVSHPANISAFFLETTRRAVAEALARFPAPPAIAGRYALVTFNDCAVDGGRYELVQEGRIIELRDDEDNIVMYGAVGASRAFLVPNDQRYASIERRAGIVVDMRVPDTNTDIIQASLSRSQPGTITLLGMPSGGCHAELRPAEIAS